MTVYANMKRPVFKGLNTIWSLLTEESRPPSVDRSRANLVWRVYGYGYGIHNFSALSHVVIPSIYLKTNVIIESGNGSSTNPYILSLDV